MSFLSLGLVVLAALIHATWNLLAKRAAHAGVAFVFAYNLVATIAYAPWVAWVLLTEGMAWSGAAVGFIFLSALIQIGRAHVELQSLMRLSYAVFRLQKKKSTMSTRR